MQYILILRELSPKEHNRVQFLNEKDEAHVLVAPELQEQYPGFGIFQRINEDEKRQINELVYSAILEFGDFLIADKTISQHLNFDGAGLWYYQKFRIFFNVLNQQHRLAEFKQNLKGASSVIVYSADQPGFIGGLGIGKVEVAPTLERNGDKIDLWSVIQYGLTVLLRFLRSLFSSNSSFFKKEYLCIDSFAQYRNMLSLDGSSIIFENGFTGYLYQKKGEEFGFIDQLLIPKFKGKDKYRFKIKHLKNHNGRTRVFGETVISKALLSLSTIKKVLRSRRALQRKYTLIREHSQHNPLQQQIIDEFGKLHLTSSFYLLKFYAYLKFFKAKKFRSIMTVDENSANYKIILDAAKQHGIFTIGYQHGNISRLSPNYMYSQTDVAQKPMPDLTITWGSKWVELLQNEGNYQPNSLAIAGQLRTDVIRPIEQSSNLHRGAIVPEIKEKHIVLFATQPQKDESLRYRAAADAILACKAVDSAHLILKLHPREYDPEFYIEIAKNHAFERYSIIRDKELYLLLKISDIVVTCFSTVGTEALYFHKPLIVLDHLKEDILHYYQDGVAYQATNANELQNRIEGILFRGECLDPSILKDYLQRSTFKIDGKVSERIWELVQSSNARKTIS